MKMLSIFLIIVGFSQCGSLNFEKNPPFKISSAVYQNWSERQAGVQGINVKIAYSSNRTIEFDSIYFSKRIVDLQIKDSKAGKMVVGYFITNQRKDMILDENPIRELENPVPIIRSFPFELDENEAVISYKFKGKIKYFKIASIKKEKSLFLPSALK